MFIAAISTGCGAIIISFTSRVFEIDDYDIFSVHYFSSTSNVEVSLEGTVRHSAMGVYKIETRHVGKTLQVITHGALVNKYAPDEVKGVLDYKLSVPDSIETVTFGEKNTIIWNKKSDHQEMRTWKFGKETNG
jgi:hypothetical protein